MAKTGARVLDAYVCPCFLGARVKKRGSSAAAIIPWLKMMTCLGLVANACVAGVFSQGLGMMTQSSACFTGCFRVLFIILIICACVRVCLYGSRTLYYFVI